MELLSHSLGAWKPCSRGWAGLAPSKGCKEEYVLCCLLASGGLLVVGISQLVEPSPPSLASSSRGVLPVCLRSLGWALIQHDWCSCKNGKCGDSKESACNAEDLGSIPGFGKMPWRREWLPTPVFLPGEFMDRGAWQGSP